MKFDVLFENNLRFSDHAQFYNKATVLYLVHQ